MDSINKLTGPAKLLGVVGLLCLAKLVYEQVQNKGNKLGFIISLVLMSVLFMYITNCVSKGDCTIMSWVLAILFAAQLLILTGIGSMQIEKTMSMFRNLLKKMQEL